MTRRMKRRAAPRTWPVPRKGTKWIRRPAPGPHAQDQSIPLVIVLRDLRHLVRNEREARLLVNSGTVKVDGKVVRDLSRGLGLMDVLSLAAPLDAHARVVKDRRGKLTLVTIPPSEASVKLGRVRFKHAIRTGKVGMTLHDGRTLVVSANSPYRVGDSLQIELPSQTIVRHLPLAPGQLAFLAGGSHVGETARVERVEVRNSSQPNLVHFKEGFSTIKEYVFIVGETSPQVTIAEGLDR
ncbi:Ribosomal protein S4e [mine drainage metagenome]|uniref:Ribosomal protein S4e n=2 Tax=mine drainage metagenome TaxID=410659 RepID=T0YUJ0_9ZZZZ